MGKGETNRTHGRRKEVPVGRGCVGSQHRVENSGCQQSLPTAMSSASNLWGRQARSLHFKGGSARQSNLFRSHG